jgi:hypothetical protein
MGNTITNTQGLEITKPIRRSDGTIQPGLIQATGGNGKQKILDFLKHYNMGMPDKNNRLDLSVPDTGVIETFQPQGLTTQAPVAWYHQVIGKSGTATLEELQREQGTLNSNYSFGDIDGTQHQRRTALFETYSDKAFQGVPLTPPDHIIGEWP